MSRRERAKARAAESNDYEFFERDDGSWMLLDEAGYPADWGDDPYEALDHARNRIAKYEALVAALRDLGFDKGWESVDRWYGSNWRPVHDALSALEER